MEWKAEQLKAIEQRGNLLVSAGAGAGKTAVLTERIVRLLRGGVDVDELLVVTFTDAAAAEMKKRIERRLLSELPSAPQLQAQLAKLGRAHISTLHAFCTRVLRRHFTIADVPPAFRVTSQEESDILKYDALNELLYEWYEREEDFPGLVWRLTPKDDARLLDIILEIHTLMVSRPDPYEWLSAACAAYFSAPTQALGLLLRQSAPRIDAALGDLLEASELLDGEGKAQELLLSECEGLRAAKAAINAGYDAFVDALQSVTFGTLRLPKDFDGERLKRLRDAAKAETRALQAMFAHTADEEAAKLAQLAPYVSLLGRLVKDFDAAYGRLKAEKGVIDFADIEHRALLALSHEDVANEYRARFLHVFVDEYQDINPVQNAIISAVSGGAGQFLVGDVKQSIYSFRQAAPELFLARREAYQSGEQPGISIPLTHNFRSSRAVIAAVNDVFCKVMNEEYGGIDYAREPLLAGRDETPPGAVELHAVLKTPQADETEAEPTELEADDEEETDEEESEDLALAEREALVAARRIKALLGTPKEDGAPLGYGDFAVLLRSAKAAADAWTRIFTLEGIPICADDSGGYFQTIEIKIMLSLLQLIDNHAQDIPLLSVLRSPIGGFTPEELSLIRIENECESYYECFVAQSGHEAPLGAKAKAFLEKLAGWRGDARLYSMEIFISRLLSQSGYYAYVGALSGGAVRQANLDALSDLAHTFEESSQKGLWNFLRFVEKLRTSSELGTALAHEGADTVKLLTIHKSKGLEFPVVILAGLSKQFNARSLRGDVLLHGSLGIGLRYIDPAHSMKKDTPLRRAIELQRKSEQLAEEMRMLYVGMTRARERLLLIGGVKDAQSIAALDGFSPRAVRRANSYMDLILPVAINLAGGNPLRAFAGLEPIGGEARVQTFVHSETESLPAMRALSQEEYLRWAKAAKKSDTTFVSERFEWKYPYGADTLAPSKLSVTQLLGAAAALTPVPRFLGRDSAVTLGIATHSVMQRLPLKPLSADEIRAFVDEMASQRMLVRAQAAKVNAAMLAGFYASELGRRMLGAQRVEREFPFSLALPANSLPDGGDSTEPVLVQGIIDCCFIEDDEWVLIDYKTDHVSGKDFAKAAEKYTGQLSLYKAALETLGSHRVRAGYIHFLNHNESVKLL